MHMSICKSGRAGVNTICKIALCMCFCLSLTPLNLIIKSNALKSFNFANGSEV